MELALGTEATSSGAGQWPVRESTVAGEKRLLIIAGWDTGHKGVPEPCRTWERWAEAVLLFKGHFNTLCVESFLIKCLPL